MVPPTRRGLLRAAPIAVLPLSGCAGSNSGRSASRSVSEDTGATVPGGTVETSPESVLIRADTDAPPIRFEDAEGRGAEGPGESFRASYGVVDSRSRADSLVVDEAVDGADADALVSATDFDAETLYLETRSVEECFRLRLCDVSWAGDEIRTNYARLLRRYDERCGADAEVFESRLIRIPEALDRGSVRSYGSGTGGESRCRGASPNDADAGDTSVSSASGDGE